MKVLAVFPRMSEFEKMRRDLDAKGLSYEIIDPSPGYSLVGCPAIALDQEARAALAAGKQCEYTTSGWVEYRPAASCVPSTDHPDFPEDQFGTASIMVVAPCIADAKKIRLIAHISGSMGAALPYLNAEMREGCYNRDGETFTFMEGHRMITLYPRRISMAKADDIVDGWRVLEKIRCRINDVCSRSSGQSITTYFPLKTERIVFIKCNTSTLQLNTCSLTPYQDLMENWHRHGYFRQKKRKSL